MIIMNSTAKFAFSMLLDVALSAAVVGGSYIYNYRIPHQLKSAGNISTAYVTASGLFDESASAVETSSGQTVELIGLRLTVDFQIKPLLPTTATKVRISR